jgi:hypothetical protein
MPGPVPQDYPFGLTDEELRAKIHEMMGEWAGRQVEFANLLPELQLAFVHAGLAEAGRRETEELRELARRAAEAADKAAGRALGIAVLALLVSAVGLVVSLAGG